MYSLLSPVQLKSWTMDSVSNSERADVKALENAKTGKITTVVVVIHLYGNTKSKSISNNAKNSAKRLN